jgi:type I restriction enzyme M protein
MAIKKSELYSKLWASCDELRGGMDASQYKDYVLVLLFIKYISDKYAGVPYAPIEVPQGASFKDMVALKGKSDIGDQINKKIIAPLANANKLSEMPDFNDANKLGTGKDMVDRLTNLIAIFEAKALDFSKNRAEGDDILGDAYEYLMRHFATESGLAKSRARSCVRKRRFRRLQHHFGVKPGCLLEDVLLLEMRLDFSHPLRQCGHRQPFGLSQGFTIDVHDRAFELKVRAAM